MTLLIIIPCYIDVDDCTDTSCVRGTCVDGINEFTCICDTGFTGDTCDTGK